MPQETGESSYRKGLMLGLTMAEIVLLLIFILLLLLASLYAHQPRADASKSGKQSIEAIVNAEMSRPGPPPLSSPVDSIIRILEESPGGRCLTSEDQQALKRLLEKHKAGVADLTKLSKSIALALPKEVRQELNIADIESEKLSKDDATRVLEQALGALRECYGLPPCWLTSSGAREYLFDITMLDSGVVVRQMTRPHRAQELRDLPLQKIRYQTAHDIDEFLKTAVPLIDQSKRQKQCRHSVLLTDETTIKATFKRQYLRLHQEFYADFRRTPG